MMYMPSHFQHDPDANGHFGIFGGRYVPETLMPLLEELEAEYKVIREDKSFWEEAHKLLEDYVGRPSPLYHAENLSSELGATIYLKREDLNHTGAHKVNNTIIQGLIAKRLGKKKVIAETGPLTVSPSLHFLTNSSNGLGSRRLSETRSLCFSGSTSMTSTSISSPTVR